VKTRTRPEQIDKILNSLDAADDMTIELETYIADLEAKQPDRPSGITRCLEEVALRHSAEAMASLEAYLLKLEANQQPVPLSMAPVSTEFLYWRSVKREKEHKAHALRKQNNSWKPI
jgi:predicted KAP-like P-loop ATPase